MQVGIYIQNNNPGTNAVVTALISQHPEVKFYGNTPQAHTTGVNIISNKQNWKDLPLSALLTDDVSFAHLHPVVLWAAALHILYQGPQKGWGSFLAQLKLKRALKKVTAVAVPTTMHQQYLQKAWPQLTTRCVVVPAFVEARQPTSSADSLKQQYTGEAEFFLAAGDDLLLALKAFSVFKKRQQSSWKLVLLTSGKHTYWQQQLATYKFRQDVVLADEALATELVFAAYAVICTASPLWLAPVIYNALMLGVPLIAPADTAVAEVAGDGALLFKGTEPEAVAAPIMQLYKNEADHKKVAAAATGQGQQYTLEKAAAILWAQLLAAAPTFVPQK